VEILGNKKAKAMEETKRRKEEERREGTYTSEEKGRKC